MNAYFDNNRNKKEINKAFCIIVDHIKANVFAISDGAVPSNKERGAILRRLLRRAMVFGRKLNINKEFMVVCADAIINEYHNTFPILKTNKNLIIDVIAKEQKTFEATLENGFKLFDNEIAHNSTIDPKTVFKLVDTYGFPYEIIKELCIQQNIKFDEDAYFTTLNKHKEISKANLSVGMNNQMKDLINFENKSEFIYELTELFASKIIGLYNKDFKIIEEANKEC
jgi:alanyl-tRNA synthetase